MTTEPKRPSAPGRVRPAEVLTTSAPCARLSVVAVSRTPGPVVRTKASQADLQGVQNIVQNTDETDGLS